MRSGPRPLFDHDQAVRLRAEYEGGWSFDRLARREGCGREAIRGAVRRAGGSLPHRGEGRIWSDEEIAEIVQARRGGMTQARLAVRFGTSQGVISHLLRNAGMPRALRGRSGGRSMTREGYVLIFVAATDPMAVMCHSTGYVMEHRLVMARQIGRPLLRSEQVHHINGEKADNRLENLELRQVDHGSGQRYVCAECGSHNVVAAELG
jgi:HNH endonuclease